VRPEGKESVTVRNFASSDTLTAVDATVRVEAFRDLDAGTLAANGCAQFFPIKTGEVQMLIAGGVGLTAGTAVCSWTALPSTAFP
jgi:hypothetical protein